jgi:15-cis-phytoene synthase
MSQFIYDWEKPLYKLAFQPIEGKLHEDKISGSDDSLLSSAYQLADDVTKENSKTFYAASSLLPKPKRQAIRALYAFCRITDDYIDQTHQDPRELLDLWQNPSISNQPQPNELIALAWADARRQYNIPWKYSQQLIHGVSQDMFKTRYEYFDELTEYCYGVASTVGLMSMHIVGFTDQKAYPYAIRLGVALQLTNILRDIGEDWRAGRVYLPKSELETFKLTYDDINEAKVTENWRAFMRFQIARNRRLYAEAKPGIDFLNRDGRFAIAAAADLYQEILCEIENNDYNVFTQRASVSTVNKLKQIPSIWYQSAVGYQKIS